MKRTILSAIALLPVGLFYAGDAHAHCYRFWFYKTPQHCGAGATYVPRQLARTADIRNVDSPPAVDIPLPSLEHMEFLPDCIVDWCQRLKGIGLLREEFGTN